MQDLYIALGALDDDSSSLPPTPKDFDPLGFGQVFNLYPSSLCLSHNCTDSGRHCGHWTDLRSGNTLVRQTPGCMGGY